MAAKTKAKNALTKTEQQAENNDKAAILLRPSVQAAVTINQWSGESDSLSLMNALSTQCEKAHDGDMSRAEAILMAQAHTLDNIFNHLARRAHRVQSLKQYGVN